MGNQVKVTEQFGKAVQFLATQARPLERALYKFEFEGGSAEDVARELAFFQNADGGFGNGLEPDIRTAASSALVTTVALQHLSRLNASSASPLVAGAIRFLTETYDKQKAGWDIVPPEVETAPRAPWWNYNPAHDGWGNPAIEIVGWFYTYKDIVPAQLLDEVTEHAITYINEQSSKKDFHELLCCLCFAELVPESLLRVVKPALDEMVANCVATDSSQWNGYCLTPVQAAESPNAIYYERLRTNVIEYLGYALTQQQEDGAWAPPWSWGQFEDVWPQAEQEWKGVLTLEALRRLKAYGIVSS